MKILFSPIGTADPLTTLGDGPMLHIVRHYQPEKVLLFLSPKFTAYEDGDSRNREAIALLAEDLGITIPQITILRGEREDVHRYDHYINTFATILTDVGEQNPGSQIIINVTSGTPAMQSALVAFDSFDQLGMRAVQVDTPKRDINKGCDREDPDDYDLATLWDLNPDRSPNTPNRCYEVESAHFRELLLRDNIRALISDYDYKGAYRVAQGSATLSDDTKAMIEGCALRLNLDGQRPAQIFGGGPFAYDPADQLTEYLRMLEVRLINEQWADFARAVTPAITETMFKVLRQALHDRKWLAQTKGGWFERKIDLEKVKEDERLKRALEKDKYLKRALSASLPDADRLPYVRNDNLLDLIAEYIGTDTDVYDRLSALRNFESGIRNKLAHELTRSSKEALEQGGSITLDEVLASLFELNDVQPGLYARINQAIIDAL